MERGKGKSCTERRVTEKENQIGKDENHLMGGQGSDEVWAVPR